MILQRRRGIIGGEGRSLLNEAAVLAAMRRAGFAAPRLLVPQEFALHELASQLSGCALLLTAHGSAMINQLWMPSDGTVLEIFPPSFAYGTGFSFAAAARHLHLSLWLDWADVDFPAWPMGIRPGGLTAERNQAAPLPYDASPPLEFPGLAYKLGIKPPAEALTTECARCAWRFVNSALAAIARKCVRARQENAFSPWICTSFAKMLDFRVPSNEHNDHNCGQLAQ